MRAVGAPNDPSPQTAGWQEKLVFDGSDHPIMMPVCALIGVALGDTQMRGSSAALILMNLHGTNTGKNWGGRRDLNPQPSEPQSDALPIELLPPQTRIITTA